MLKTTKIIGLTLIIILVLVFVVNVSSKEYFIQGTILDYETGKPVEDALVSANQTGWNFSNFPSVMWDYNYVFNKKSDERGKFHITYDVGNSAHVVVNKDGYVPFEDWYPENSSSIVIKLKPRDPNYVPLERQLIQIGVENNRPYGWIFAEQRTTFNEDGADIFPVVDSIQDYSKYSFSLKAPGGIIFVSADELGVNSDLLVFSDEAPADNYNDSAQMATKDGGQAGVYFVRTHDGSKYAKFEFDPESFGTIGSEKDFGNGTWGLLLNGVYNGSGSRNLRYEG